MAVHDRERERVERLARELAPKLRERGSIVVDAGDVENLEQWRRVGRLLGWHVRTGATPDGGAWVASEDYEVSKAAKREAIAMMASS